MPYKVTAVFRGGVLKPTRKLKLQPNEKVTLQILRQGKAAVTEEIRVFSTWEVVSETLTLLTYRLHPQAAIEFLDTMKSALSLVPLRRGVVHPITVASRPQDPAAGGRCCGPSFS